MAKWLALAKKMWRENSARHGAWRREIMPLVAKDRRYTLHRRENERRARNEEESKISARVGAAKTSLIRRWRK